VVKTSLLRLKPAAVPIAAGVTAALVVATLSGPQQIAVPLSAPLGPVPAGLTALPATPTVAAMPAIADLPHRAAP
jgi:hypothetical protein